MSKKERIAIIGETVLVEGVAARLADDPQVTVLRLQESDSQIPAKLLDFQPDVIIFPLSRPEAEAPLSRLSNRTVTRLVGLDIDCNQVLILDGKMHFSLSMQALQQLITEAAPDPRGILSEAKRPPLSADTSAIVFREESA